MDVHEIAELANDTHAMNKEFGDYSFLGSVANDTEQLESLAMAFGQLVIDDNNLQSELMLTTNDEEKLRFLIANGWLEGIATGFKCCLVKNATD